MADLDPLGLYPNSMMAQAARLGQSRFYSAEAITPPITYATFDGVASNTTLSNGNLTASHANGTYGGARSTALKSTGKYYFEIKIVGTDAFTDGAGILLSTGTYLDMANGTAPTAEVVYGGGTVYANGSGQISLGACVATNTVCAAIDFDNRRVWFRRNSGTWNNSGTANPATNTGGFILPAGSYAPAVVFQGSTGGIVTGNFGASAFTFTPPSNFVAWG